MNKLEGERDINCNLTDMALAVDALRNHGCDCGVDEPGTCLACLCMRALKTERARALAAENDVAKLSLSHLNANDDFSTVEECARRFRCCKETIRRRIRTGEIRFVRVGRKKLISKFEVERYLKSIST